MPKFKIGNISGTTNIIGDNNIINNNSNMSRDEFFRDEAQRFIDYNVESNSSIANGHKVFANELRQELAEYYSVEDKMSFLDEVKKGIDSYISTILRENPDTDIDILEKMLFFLNQEINALPKILKENQTQQKSDRTTVFICYSRKDIAFLDDLKRHFRPLEKYIQFWEDSKIDPGKNWKKEIELAIETAKVSILLISADFFNSDFIETEELPRLLKKADDDGLTILNVFLKPCMYDEYPGITQYQGINDPKRTVSSLNENDREELWVELVRQVRDIVTK